MSRMFNHLVFICQIMIQQKIKKKEKVLLLLHFFISEDAKYLSFTLGLPLSFIPIFCVFFFLFSFCSFFHCREIKRISRNFTQNFVSFNFLLFFFFFYLVLNLWNFNHFHRSKKFPLLHGNSFRRLI